MPHITTFITSLVLLCPVAVFAQQPSSPVRKEDEGPQRELLFKARTLLTSKNPLEAIQTYIDPVLKYYEQHFANEKRQIYCAQNSTMSLGLLLQAANDNKDAIVLSGVWSDAWYMKAYAQLELKQVAEAKESLIHAVNLSPNNSQYLSELAHVYQLEKNWELAKQTFQNAIDSNGLIVDKQNRNLELGRALRGLGYVLVELGKFSEAEQQYQKCLELNPKDRSAKAELDYIHKKLAAKAGEK